MLRRLYRKSNEDSARPQFYFCLQEVLTDGHLRFLISQKYAIMWKLYRVTHLQSPAVMTAASNQSLY